MKIPDSIIYLEQKLSNKNKNIVKDKYLFANGVKSIKIMPEKLPNYYVKIKIADINAYIKTKDVKYLILDKRVDHNVLYISYKIPIVKRDEHYEGFDLFLYDENILLFLKGVELFSKIDISFIEKRLEEEKIV